MASSSWWRCTPASACSWPPASIRSCWCLPVAGFLFVIGFATYRLLIARALRTRTNVGMAQVFVTFGLAIFLRGIVQLLWTPEYRSIKTSWMSGITMPIVRHLPAAAAARGGGGVPRSPSPALTLLINKHRFRPRHRGHARGFSTAVGLVGIDRHRIFAHRLGHRRRHRRRRRRHARDVLLHLPRCRRELRVDRLCHRRPRRLRQHHRRIGGGRSSSAWSRRFQRIGPRTVA